MISLPVINVYIDGQLAGYQFVGYDLHNYQDLTEISKTLTGCYKCSHGGVFNKSSDKDANYVEFARMLDGKIGIEYKWFEDNFEITRVNDKQCYIDLINWEKLKSRIESVKNSAFVSSYLNPNELKIQELLLRG